MFKLYILPLFTVAIIAGAPVYASDSFEILTEDEFLRSNQTESHPALIEPAAGAAEPLDVSPARIMTEDQLFANDPETFRNVSITNTNVPSIYSEHDY